MTKTVKRRTYSRAVKEAKLARFAELSKTMNTIEAARKVRVPVGTLYEWKKVASGDLSRAQEKKVRYHAGTSSKQRAPGAPVSIAQAREHLAQASKLLTLVAIAIA